MLQRARPHAVGRLQHDGGHGRFDAIKQPCNPVHLPEGNVNPGQTDQNQQGGQHKQHARHHTAPSAVHQPTDVGGQLLRLGSRQDHAVIQCM